MSSTARVEAKSERRRAVQELSHAAESGVTCVSRRAKDKVGDVVNCSSERGGGVNGSIYGVDASRGKG